jgi:hypothetical protein
MGDIRVEAPERYNLAFQGELLPGHEPAEVKRQFASMFYIDDESRIDAFFAGQHIVLRRNLCKDDAANLFVAMRKLGLVTHIEPVDSAAVTPRQPTVEAEPNTGQIMAVGSRVASRVKRRRRQPGAPNLFDLRLSERAGIPFEPPVENPVRVTAPLVAAAISFMAFILVGARFIGQIPVGVQSIAQPTDTVVQMDPSLALDVVTLVILFVATAGLLALGVFNRLGGKIYIPPADRDEPEFDINNGDIEWLAPADNLASRSRSLGYLLLAGALSIFSVAMLAQLSLWGMLAIAIAIAGCAGLYAALLRARRCHLGVLDDRLILVDHTNTYRVGSGPKIQYFKNYVMIDDVIVYLGNALWGAFAAEPLHQRFEPVFNTGIKVDRATLQVKLIQRRHPVWLGFSGLSATFLVALLLLLIG